MFVAAIVSGGKGTAQDKIKSLNDAGVKVVESPAKIGAAMYDLFKERGLLKQWSWVSHSPAPSSWNLQEENKQENPNSSTTHSFGVVFLIRRYSKDSTNEKRLKTAFVYMLDWINWNCFEVSLQDIILGRCLMITSTTRNPKFR